MVKLQYSCYFFFEKNFYFTEIHITLHLAIIEAPGKALAVIRWFNGLNTSNCGMHGPTFGNAPPKLWKGHGGSPILMLGREGPFTSNTL